MKRLLRNVWWSVLGLLPMVGAYPSLAESSPPLALDAAQEDAAARAQGWMEQGRKAYRQKRFQAAADAYAKAYQLAPSLLSALYNRAYALRKAEDFAGAEKLYREVLARQPDDMDALFGWAESLRLLNRTLEAKSAFEAYVAKETREGKSKYIAYARQQILSIAEPKRSDDDEKTKVDEKRAKEELASAKRAYKKKEYVVAAEKYEIAY
jgi:tetratricopeptide (TPR) repeat protein